MLGLLRILVVVALVWVPFSANADTTAPYSKPYHKQGRGWYPSIYWSTGRNLGSYYFPNTDGELFEQLSESEWDKETNGLVYFYRPDSQWASEELEAPSYYVNDEIVFNLRGNSYTVIELPAGSYDITARKSLLPLIGFEAFDDKLMIAFDLNLLADIGMEIDPGSIHYIRHSEVSLPARLHPDLSPDDEMATADVQLVDEELALREMSKTRYLTHSFWTPNDSERVQELLKGEMQDYGWFSIIWPWSNNFIFGFPLFYLPSDMYRELRGGPDLTLEEELYALREDKEEYLEAIQDLRQPKRNWLAPWRAPRSGLTLNDELMLDRLERAAQEGEIVKPKSMIEREEAQRQAAIEAAAQEDEWWFWPDFDGNDDWRPPEIAGLNRRMDEERRAEFKRMMQVLN